MAPGNPTFDAGRTLDRWEGALDPRRARAWRRRILYKRALWQVTFGLAEGLKRGLDLGGSLAALLLFSPVFLVTAACIRLEDAGPILYRQVRVGQGGRPFKMLKFRSMVTNADALRDRIAAENKHGQDAVTFKIADDPRVTRVGRFIRKYSIDEFPQFLNVLRGDMSLVGPRPSLPQEVTRYKAWQLRRLKVKPGITCLWQVGGRSDIDFEGQVRLDLQYIASESLWTDVKILVKTIPAVLSGRGAY